jgi:amidohydrolase
MPELSGEEHMTAARVKSLLARFEPDNLIEGLGGTGLAAIFDGNQAGHTVMVRCELDGLPITETGSYTHCSENQGKGHQCGHDGHMSILLGVAQTLTERRPARGRTVLLFQPAEENGKGARAVIADPRFREINADYVLSLHNLPGYDLHQIILKAGQVNCASRGMRIRFAGKTAHASMPETGRSPALAMTSSIEQLNALSNTGTMDETFALVTIVHAHLGEKAFGVAPGDAEIWVTLRSVTDAQMDMLVEKATTITKDAAAAHQLGWSIEFDDVFRACSNDTWLIEQYRQSAHENQLVVEDLSEPLRFSEDFGEYGNIARSAMFFLGAGRHHPALHNPDYDFPDELIRSGAMMFYATINRLLGENLTTE